MRNTENTRVMMNTARYLANNDAPDLILLDAMMPGMSG